jgi:F0F1-type ATP synthase assembly protein I
MILVSAAFGWLCHEMAKTRNRDTTVWAVLGFLFGLISVIVLALLGKVEK